jgi:hypothetical protein
MKFGDGIADRIVKAQSARRASNKLGGSDCVGEFLGQEGDDPLGAAIRPRRDTFEERSDLGNLHT